MSACDICNELAEIKATLADHGDKLSILLTGVGALVAALPPSFTVDAVNFDGTNDYMTRGANLTGIADSSTGILSAWVNLNAAPAGGLNVFTNDLFTASLGIDLNNDDKVYIDIAESTFTDYLGLISTGTVTSTDGWVHILASWNVNFTSGSRVAHLYINDADNLAINTDTGGAFSASLAASSNWFVGTDPSTTTLSDFDAAELYYAPGQFLDFSVVANRRKFIDATGKPVDLGSDGSTPTGSVPAVYLHIDDGEAAANFATNAGSGGDFTVTGALTTAGTSPSD